MRKAIVTGATSYIGIALIKNLIRSGYRVAAVIRPGSSRADVINMECPDANIIECDITNMTRIQDCLVTSWIGEGIDDFYHIGWSSDFKNPRYNLESQMRNSDFAVGALRAAAELGCKKFLGVGSQAECGLVDKSLNSQTPDNPITAYAKAKCVAYDRCCELSDKLGVEFYWPRLLSAYGPYDRPQTLVMSCITACIKHKEMTLSNAEQIWDYVYVDEVATALRLITEKGKPKKKYSIASGVGRPLREYIQDIADVYEFPELMSGIGKRPYAENEVMHLVGDVTEIYKDTGMVFDPDFKKHIALMKEKL